MTPDNERCARVLVVEDETMIAMLIEDVLADLGYEVVGPAGKLASALQLAREERIDAAILDVTIRGGQVFPVADILRERGIPFVLASGYGAWTLPDTYKGVPLLQKPFSAGQAANAIAAICRPQASSASANDPPD